MSEPLTQLDKEQFVRGEKISYLASRIAPLLVQAQESGMELDDISIATRAALSGLEIKEISKEII